MNPLERHKYIKASHDIESSASDAALAIRDSLNELLKSEIELEALSERLGPAEK